MLKQDLDVFFDGRHQKGIGVAERSCLERTCLAGDLDRGSKRDCYALSGRSIVFVRGVRQFDLDGVISDISLVRTRQFEKAPVFDQIGLVSPDNLPLDGAGARWPNSFVLMRKEGLHVLRNSGAQ